MTRFGVFIFLFLVDSMSKYEGQQDRKFLKLNATSLVRLSLDFLCTNTGQELAKGQHDQERHIVDHCRRFGRKYDS